jgi:hypothetical protein
MAWSRRSARRSQVSNHHLVRAGSGPLARTTRKTYLFQIRYNRSGQPKAFGAQAQNIDAEEAEEKGWKLAQNFKLHLHPKTMTAQNPISLDPLPPGVTIEKIYVDFFTYVCQHTQKFFEEREVQGKSIWQRLKGENRIEFVIAHPNGWTLSEQVFLRKVVFKSASGFVSKEPTSLTVYLIAEAEASVHFMILHGGLEKSLEVSSWNMRPVYC